MGPMRTLARSLRQLARRLLTPFSLRSVRKLSTLFVRKLTSSIITVSVLLGMNLMLLLDLLAFMKSTMGRAMDMVMEDMGVIRIFDVFLTTIDCDKINRHKSLPVDSFFFKKKKKKKKKK